MLFSDNIEYSHYICQQIKELTIMINELFSNDQILSTKSVFLAFQFIDILKFSAKSLQTGNQQCGTEFLLQDIKNSCCHHILSLL